MLIMFIVVFFLWIWCGVGVGGVGLMVGLGWVCLVDEVVECIDVNCLIY